MGEEYVQRYQGHQNAATVKGVNFYGPQSQYVVCGSDCGNILIGDKATEGIVTLVPGEDTVVVNVLEPHPSLPMLARRGLDNQMKMWMPTDSMDKDHEYRKKIVCRNLFNGQQKGKMNLISSHSIY